MRTPSILLCIVFLLATGCSAAPAAPTPTPTAAESPGAVPGSGYEPVPVAMQLLEKAGTRWVEPPAAVLVQQMPLAQARELLPAMGPPEDQSWEQQTLVWFVIFRGSWRLMPYGQTEGPPAPAVYQGCGFALFTAAGRELIAAGDSRCPGEP